MTAAAMTRPEALSLPVPLKDGAVAVERAFKLRRSVREFAPVPVAMSDVSQLLWAAQGLTTTDGRRTAPSAGALYPLEVYVVAGNVENLAAGVYHYDPRLHRLEAIAKGDRRAGLSRAAFEQEFIAQAPAAIVIAAVHARTATKYGARAERYCAIEAGCAAQNIALQAVALGLGTVVVGAFDDARVREAASMQRSEMPLIIMPIGKPRH